MDSRVCVCVRRAAVWRVGAFVSLDLNVESRPGRLHPSEPLRGVASLFFFKAPLKPPLKAPHKPTILTPTPSSELTSEKTTNSTAKRRLIVR